MKYLDKAEVIGEIISLYDEVTKLTHENLALRTSLASCNNKDAKDIDEDGYMKRPWFIKIYQAGREHIWDKYGKREYYAMSVLVKEDEDGNRVAQSFDAWYDYRYEKFPSFMSKEDFKLEFYSELYEKYKVEKAKALGDD